MDELRQTTERLAIHRLIAVYAQLIDSGRLDDWGQLFTEEARFRVYGQTYESRATIVAEIGGMLLPPDRPGKHISLVPIIDLTGDDRALATVPGAVDGHSGGRAADLEHRPFVGAVVDPDYALGADDAAR